MENERRGLVNRKWIIAILVYIGLIAICCIALYVVPSIKGALERTYIAEYGTIDVTDEVSAFIVRDEIVYTAEEKGNINRLAEADKLVRAGARVIELTPMEDSTETAEDTGTETTEPTEEAAEGEEAAAATDETAQPAADGEEAAAADETAQDTTYENMGKYAGILEELGDAAVVSEGGCTNNAGFVSYYVDGAEGKLTSDALDSLSYDDYKELTGRKVVKTPDKQCGKGYPVFKVVRNKKWYLVYYISNDAAAKYTEGDTVTIDAGDDKVEVSVHQVLEGSKESRITLSCKTFFDGFFEMRSLDTTVTVASAQGLVLEDESIVEAPDGMRGVFVKNKLGEHIFTPVRVKADNGTKCVAYSDIYVDAGGNYVETIGTYDEIISEPTEEDLAGLAESHPAPAQEDEGAEGEQTSEGN